MTTKQAIGILQVVEPLSRSLVAAVGDEPIGLQEAGRTHELVRIPPERRAGGRAARAQDALVQAVELLALLGGLQPLLFRRRVFVDQIGLHRVVLLEELSHVDDQVADHRQPGQRPQFDGLLQVAQLGDAGEPILAVDVHGVRAAHAFPARTPQAQAVVLLLDTHQRIEQHAVMRIERDLVVPHRGSFVLVRVVAENPEAHASPSAQ